MRVVADHCIPSDVVHALRDAGIHVERALERGLDRAPDEELFEYARKTSQVLLTFDHDFANITRFRIEHSAGIVLVSIEGMSSEAIINHVCTFLTHTRARRLRGRLFLIDQEGIRLWPKR